MVDNWIDHIELRRNAYATFAVWGNKYGEDPITGRRRWFDWDKTRNLRSPMEVYKAIEDEAAYLNVEVEWFDVIPSIASIDWLTAAVIANKTGQDVPRLPDLTTLQSQRSLRLGRLTIGAEWGYDMHELVISFERWIRILLGEPWSTNIPYFYEGQRFVGNWSFDGDRNLSVTYGDGGVGWEASLNALDFIKGPQIDEVDLARLALDAD